MGRSSRLVASLVLFALLTAVLLAQRPTTLRPRVFAIRDARVVPEAGKELPRATVVIRDGVIEAVGPDAKVPADALVIEGKGLTVYPGFLDAMSHWGFDPALRRSGAGPAAPEDPASEALANTKPDNRKGVTPEFQVGTALKSDDEQADAWRRIGFTAHLVAPEGGIIVGQSALVSLSDAPPREAVLRAPVAQHIAFRGVGGNDYPRALMGIVAHARQVFRDAEHFQRLVQYHKDNGPPGRRPPRDPALAELGLALKGEMAVVFEADTRDQIERALDFAAEHKVQPVVFGGADAWKVADRLHNEKTPVLLRLALSETPRPRGRAAGPFAVEGSPEAENKPPTRREQERERQRKEEEHNAALLHQKGILFAFSTDGVSGDKPAEKFRAHLRKVIAAGLPADAALRALTSDAAKILGVEKQMGTITAGKAAHLVVMDGDFHDEQTQIHAVFADGVRFEYETKPRTAKKTEEPKKPDSIKPPTAAPGEQACEIEADRIPKMRTGGTVLLKNATVLTITNGVKENADVFIEKGKIRTIGPHLEAGSGVTVIDCSGMFVMPGIIDTHCHFAISGGINEFSLSIVPEVRVRDVIDSEDVQIYRALGGGVTTARLLHGSSNVIGGQDAVIKLKYGQPADKLLVPGSRTGIKFALGENVKRTDGRFPNSRLGVEAVLVRAFTEARIYKETRDSQTSTMPPLRTDLRLEALAAILDGKADVHCHCYRADEILMLLRVANRFGFKVRSLQHVLEGYKIAAEIADHGASCSTFSDWWAYKMEALDAIPYNMALLHEAGAKVCLKSDSNELMRHLYQEAAKCIKYGGLSETEALKMITLNAAEQLGLSDRLGSLEPGKDGDIAIFNDHPLNGYSRVEMALVEGEVYFQRSEKLKPAPHASIAPAKPHAAFPPIPRDDTYWISGATVHPANGTPMTDVVVKIHKGRIAALLPGALPSGTTGTIVDARGLHLYPGMIDAGSVLGLTELGSAKETSDYAESGDFQPDLRASTAINPNSSLIPVTRANGVTTVVTRPTGSIIAGQSALINLAGWVPREMTLIDPLALHIDFPATTQLFSSDPNGPAIARAVAKKQREEKVRRMKELFRQAIAHDEARKSNPKTPADPRLEALAPYVRGDKPVVIQAHRKGEIHSALDLADEMKLKVVLSGAIDAWKLAPELKKRDVPVILGPVMTLPQESYDPYDAPFACAARLHEAGVRFCIRSGGASNTRNLPYEAAMAVSYGLPPDVGLKAVTLYPAEILGFSDELGSIERGKRANLVLTNGDLLQPSTQVLALFIDGKPLEPVSKHTRLYERYRERLREVRDGRAPLGTK